MPEEICLKPSQQILVSSPRDEPVTTYFCIHSMIFDTPTFACETENIAISYLDELGRFNYFLSCKIEYTKSSGKDRVESDLVNVS